MTNRLPIILAIVALILAGFALTQRSATSVNVQTHAANNETSLDRILRTGVVRCAYIVYPPYFTRDANTGDFGGIFYEAMEAVAKSSKLQVNWVEEVGFDTIFSGFESNRYDVFCGGLWPSATRARAGYFSAPLFYNAVRTWVRPDETRFQQKADINRPEVKISTIDGAMEDVIARADFPLAKRVSVPQLSPFTQNFLNVQTGKADMTFAEASIVAEFLENNPGALKELFPTQPMRTFGNTFVLKRGEHELQAFLNVAINELLYMGRIDAILDKYEPVPGMFLRVGHRIGLISQLWINKKVGVRTGFY